MIFDVKKKFSLFKRHSHVLLFHTFRSNMNAHRVREINSASQKDTKCLPVAPRCQTKWSRSFFENRESEGRNRQKDRERKGKKEREKKKERERKREREHLANEKFYASTRRKKPTGTSLPSQLVAGRSEISPLLDFR